MNLVTLYLDWFNNFLTVSGFAEHYGFTESEALDVIHAGRNLHELEVLEARA